VDKVRAGLHHKLAARQSLFHHFTSKIVGVVMKHRRCDANLGVQLNQLTCHRVFKKCLIRGKLDQTFLLTRQQFPDAANIFLIKSIASERKELRALPPKPEKSLYKDRYILTQVSATGYQDN
jgi:hypothetical protein